jgi:hypothetical protein
MRVEDPHARQRGGVRFIDQYGARLAFPQHRGIVGVKRHSAAF